MLEGVFIKRRKVYELNGILCTFTVFGSLFYLLSHERRSSRTQLQIFICQSLTTLKLFAIYVYIILTDFMVHYAKWYIIVA